MKKVLFCLVIVFAIALNAGAQKNKDKNSAFLTFALIVEQEVDYGLKDAVAKMYEKGKLVQTLQTPEDGVVTLSMKPNTEYIIEISKSGYVTKTISINTAIPNYENQQFEVAFPIGLFVPCEGLDYSLLNQPVLKMVYDDLRRDFFPEKAYDNIMVSKLEQLNKANTECLDEQYNSIVRKADRLFVEKKYVESRSTYLEALDKRPKDKHVKNRIEEIDRILAEQKDNDKDYNEYIAQADKQFTAKDYALSREFYTRALSIKAGEQYPKDRIAEIDRLLAQKDKDAQNKQLQDQQFQQLIDKGDDAADADICGKALQAYRDAQKLKPTDKLVQKRITDAEAKCAAIEAKASSDKDKQAQNKARKDSYDAAIAEADKTMAAGDLNKAREAYQKAQQIMASEAYPAQKINEIEKIQKSNDQEKEHQYKKLVSDAEKAFDREDLGGSKDLLNKALAMKPDDMQVKEKIQTIDKIMAEQQRLESEKKVRQEQYNKLVADADAALKKGDYNTAADAYKKALTVVSTEAYPKQKLNEIEDMKQAQAEKSDKDYQLKIQSGDKNFAIKNYEQALADYKAAQSMKASEAYPGLKIDEINKIVAEKQRADADKKAKDDAYNSAVAKADALMKAKDYDKALIAYKEAYAANPESNYPYSKMDEISQIKKQLEADDKYKKAMATADSYVAQKLFDQAKNFYGQALDIKPNDATAKEKIAKVDQDIATALKNIADAKTKQATYDKSIADADKNFNLKDYEMARANYQTAQAIFGDKDYPKQRLAEIEKIFAERKRNADYHEVLDEANALLAAKNYEQAKAKYQAASLIKPSETFPSDKIKEVDIAMEKIRSEKAKLEQTDKEYQDVLSKANDLFDKSQYDAAKKEYERALTIKAGESFPKQRIARVNEIKSLLAKDSKTSNTPKPAAGSEKKIVDLKFKNESELQSYLKDLVAKYPEGISVEVYKEKNRTVTRYVVIRENQANDFREIVYNWGGIDYIKNDKPVTQLYFSNQVKTREGEYYNKAEM